MFSLRILCNSYGTKLHKEDTKDIKWYILIQEGQINTFLSQNDFYGLEKKEFLKANKYEKKNYI